MNTPLSDKNQETAGGILGPATAAAGKLSRSTLAWGGLALGAVVLLGVNLIASSAFRGTQLDATEDGLYTISQGTRKALSAIDEPVDIRLYYSKQLGEVAPNFAKSFDRVRSLLEQYQDISGGKLRVSVLDPEPFTDAEDRAVADGLRGVRLNNAGDMGYFGLIGSNSTDNEAKIHFVSPERERFLEYDVTKLVYTLANPDKRVIGMMSGIPLNGAPPNPMTGGQPRPPQIIMGQINEFFEVRDLDRDIKEIPADIDVVMLAQPDGLSVEGAYAVDQFALRGGKVLVFVDPLSEINRFGPMGAPSPAIVGELGKLFKAWGIAFDHSKVAADISNARRVQFGSDDRGPVVTDYVAWLTLDKSALDQSDVLSGSIERLNLATPGFLKPEKDATTKFSSILRTSPNAMAIDAGAVAIKPDAVALLRNYKPGGERLTLAARVTGEAKSAFPDGPPPLKKSEEKAEGEKAADAKEDEAARKAAEEADKAHAELAKKHIASGNVTAIVVADTDVLSDQFWVSVQQFLGEQIAVPLANNNAFVLGALENLSGSDALISLRGRGISDRPFELVDDIRRDAERRFRDKEETLTEKLKQAQEELAKLEKAADGETLVLGEKDREAIDRYRAEMLSTRRELRDVKHELKKDIDQLDGWLKFWNIAAVPLAIGIGGFGWAAWRRRRNGSA